MKKFIEAAKAALSAIANASNKGPQHQAQIATVAALEAAAEQIEALESRIAALEQIPAPAPSEATA